MKNQKIISKKFQVGLSIFMSVCFSFLFFSPTLNMTSYAASNEAVLNVFKSEEAIYSQMGRTANTDLAAKIRELGIPVTDNSLIEIIPAQEGVSTEIAQEEGSIGIRKASLNMEDEYIYSVVNVDGNSVTRHFIALYEEQVTGYQPFAIVGSGTKDGGFVWPSGTPLTVTGYITFNYYQDDMGLQYASPQSCTAKITQIASGKTCSSLTASFSTDGALYSYPELKMKQVEYSHLIGIAELNPQINTVYTRSRPLPTSTGVIHFQGLGSGFYYEIAFNIRDGSNLQDDFKLVIKGGQIGDWK